MTEGQTLPDFQVVMCTANSCRNVHLVVRRGMINENDVFKNWLEILNVFDIHRLDGFSLKLKNKKISSLRTSKKVYIHHILHDFL